MAACVMFMKENLRTVRDKLLRAQKNLLPSMIVKTPHRALSSARARTAARTPSSRSHHRRTLARSPLFTASLPSAADEAAAAALRLTLLRRRRRCHFFKVCRGDRSAISHGGAGAR